MNGEKIVDLGKNVTAWRTQRDKSRAQLYVDIGRFIIQFSGLDGMLKHLIASALGLRDQREMDIVVSHLDFSMLCKML